MDTIAALSPNSAAMPAAGTTTVPRSGNQNIDGIIQGSKWSGSVTYGFPDSPSDYPYSVTGEQVSIAEMQAIQHFLEGFSGGPGSIYDPVESFTNLSISQTPVGAGGADIMIG